MGFPLSPSMILTFDARGHGAPWLSTLLLLSLLQRLEAQVSCACGAGHTSCCTYYGIIHGLTAQLPVIYMIAIDGAFVLICVFDQ